MPPQLLFVAAQRFFPLLPLGDIVGCSGQDQRTALGVPLHHVAPPQNPAPRSIRRLHAEFGLIGLSIVFVGFERLLDFGPGRLKVFRMTEPPPGVEDHGELAVGITQHLVPRGLKKLHAGFNIPHPYPIDGPDMAWTTAGRSAQGSSASALLISFSIVSKVALFFNIRACKC